MLIKSLVLLLAASACIVSADPSPHGCRKAPCSSSSFRNGGSGVASPARDALMAALNAIADADLSIVDAESANANTISKIVLADKAEADVARSVGSGKRQAALTASTNAKSAAVSAATAASVKTRLAIQKADVAADKIMDAVKVAAFAEAYNRPGKDLVDDAIRSIPVVVEAIKDAAKADAAATANSINASN